MVEEILHYHGMDAEDELATRATLVVTDTQRRLQRAAVVEMTPTGLASRNGEIGRAMDCRGRRLTRELGGEDGVAGRPGWADTTKSMSRGSDEGR